MTGREVIRILQKHGYLLDHVSGSHHIMKKAGLKNISVPVHGKKDLGKGMLKDFERETGLKFIKR